MRRFILAADIHSSRTHRSTDGRLRFDAKRMTRKSRLHELRALGNSLGLEAHAVLMPSYSSDQGCVPG